MYSFSEQKKYLLKFVSTVSGLFIAICYLLPAETLDFRKNPFDLRSLSKESVIAFRSVPYWVRQEIKVGQIENFELPKIGVFGDHTAQFFSSKVFEEDSDLLFFNYFIDGATLPQLANFIDYEGKAGRLPNLLLFQITNPRVHAGSLLINPRTVKSGEVFSENVTNQYSIFKNGWKVAKDSFQVFKGKVDWAQVSSSIIPGQKKYIMEPKICSAPVTPNPENIFYNILPGFLKRQLSKREFIKHLCSVKFFSGYLRDGSNWIPDKTLGIQDLPREGVLQPEDIETIANYLKAIQASVRKAGKKIVFFTQPINRSDHHGPLDQILTRSIQLCDNLIILEKRFENYEKDYFVLDEEHPGPKFYLELVEELKKRKLLHYQARNISDQDQGI